MILDIINKKRLGLELSYQELSQAFNGFLNGDVYDYQMSSLLMAICINGMTDDEIFSLTKIFIDTSFIIALAFENDENNERAVELVNILKEDCYINNSIVNEQTLQNSNIYDNNEINTVVKINNDTDKLLNDLKDNKKYANFQIADFGDQANAN